MQYTYRSKIKNIAPVNLKKRYLYCDFYIGRIKNKTKNIVQNVMKRQ